MYVICIAYHFTSRRGYRAVGSVTCTDFTYSFYLDLTMPPRGKRKAAKENQTAKKAKVEKPRLVKHVFRYSSYLPRNYT